MIVNLFERTHFFQFIIRWPKNLFRFISIKVGLKCSTLNICSDVTHTLHLPIYQSYFQFIQKSFSALFSPIFDECLNENSEIDTNLLKIFQCICGKVGEKFEKKYIGTLIRLNDEGEMEQGEREKGQIWAVINFTQYQNWFEWMTTRNPI